MNTKSNKKNDRESGQVENIVRHIFKYDDMLKAFKAGRKHMKECGETNKDCWDFATWIKENYA